MKVVLQRVKKARVTVDNLEKGKINKGLLIFIGIRHDDTENEATFLAAKCSQIRVFSDENGKMNLSLEETGGEALVISQFTLYGNCNKGRRPSFNEAASPEKGENLYKYFISKLNERITIVNSGVFGAMMDIESTNDGPVTFILEKQ